MKSTKYNSILFKQRKPKQFNPKSRFKNDNEQLQSDDFASKWERIKKSNKHKPALNLSSRTLILALITLLICMYLLDKKVG